MQSPSFNYETVAILFGFGIVFGDTMGQAVQLKAGGF